MDFFYMPTKVIFEEGCLDTYQEQFTALGQKALIVTGKSSAKKSGALKDLTEVFHRCGIDYEVFDRIMENPTVEILEEAYGLFKDSGIEFVIGIGGGSPLDASKMISVMLAEKLEDGRVLFENKSFKSLPVIAIPTTSGTGSETTPYSIITDHGIGNKVTCKARVFPMLALLDVRYFMTMPEAITRSTAIDALSHLVEGYLVKNANLYSDQLALAGLGFFRDALPDLLAGDFSKGMHENLIHASTLAGMVISHSGTGIPHGMGYHLTYNHGEKHGKATGLFLASMLKLHTDRSPRKLKGQKVLDLLGLEDVQAFRRLILDIVGPFTIDEEDLLEYAKIMTGNKRKLQSHDFDISYEDMEWAFRYSLQVTRQ